jgi:hypothetical protein
VLDVEPVSRASRARPSRSVDQAIAERGWVEADHLRRITGEARTANVGRWVVDPGVLSRAKAELSERITRSGERGVELATLGERERAVLAELIDVEVSAGRAVSRAHKGAGLSAEADRVLTILEDGRWSPPTLPVSDRGALRELERAGLVVEATDMWFAMSSVRDAARVLAKLCESRPGGFTVSEARDALGNSRKHAVPLLGYLDSVRATRRQGDVRIPGARLAAFVGGEPLPSRP